MWAASRLKSEALKQHALVVDADADASSARTHASMDRWRLFRFSGLGPILGFWDSWGCVWVLLHRTREAVPSCFVLASQLNVLGEAWIV